MQKQVRRAPVNLVGNHQGDQKIDLWSIIVACQSEADLQR